MTVHASPYDPEMVSIVAEQCREMLCEVDDMALPATIATVMDRARRALVELDELATWDQAHKGAR